jgi:hypothetical protein
MLAVLVEPNVRPASGGATWQGAGWLLGCAFDQPLTEEEFQALQ